MASISTSFKSVTRYGADTAECSGGCKQEGILTAGEGDVLNSFLRHKEHAKQVNKKETANTTINTYPENIEFAIIR